MNINNSLLVCFYKKKLALSKFLFVVILSVSQISNSFGATKTFTNVTATSGNFLFSTAANWGGALPNASDALVINGTCTVDNAAANLAYANLTVNATKTLSWITSGTAILNVANITNNGTISMANGGKIIITTATAWTVGTFTAGTGTIEIQNTLTLPAGITTFNNLIINGSAKTVTQGVNTVINGNLTITLGAYTTGAFSISVSGTTTVSGTLNINSATGAKTFEDISITGTFNNSANVPITINGSLTNNGTFTQGTGMVTFGSSGSNTVTGTATTTAFGGGITVNKGTLGTTADTVNVIDIQCVITVTGGLTLTHGTFKLSSASTFVTFVQPANSTNNVIPLPSKLWCNNAGAVMDKGTVSFDWGIAGEIQLDAGTINLGIASDDRLAPNAGGTAMLRINGGAFNIAGRVSFATNNWSYVMTGGTLTVGIVGNTLAGRDPFNMDSAASSFTMTGGTIIIQSPNTGTTPNLGYHNVGTLGRGFLGGTLQMGNSSSPAGTILRIETDRAIYNLVVASANVTAQFQSPTSGAATTVDTVYNNVDVQLGVLDIGAGSQSLFVGGDWTIESAAGTPFVPGTQRVTFYGSKAQNIGGTKSTTFYDVTINNTTSTLSSATITLAQPEYISHSLTLTRGYVNTDATNILWMQNSSTTNIGSANSFVNGPMNYDMAVSATARALTFPIGKSTDWRYAILTAKNTNATSVTFNAEVFNASAAALGWTKPATVDTVSEVHYWDIKRYSSYPSTESSVTVSGNQIIQLYFEANDVVKDGSKITVCKNVNGGSAWVDIGGSGGPAYAAGANLTGTITSTSAPTAFTSFSRFTIGSLLTGWNPLPIELLNFTATPCSNNVCLNWITATETNNDYFTIEKTKDGVNFSFVAKVTGAGNSVTQKEYSTIDNLPYDGVSYYRLKQTDYDGNHTYSTLRMVDFTASAIEFGLEIYPNPSTGTNISLAINANKGKEILVVVYDVTGRESYSKVFITGQNGRNVFGLDPSGKLAPGLYLITATSDDSVLSKKLIVK